MDKMNSQPKSSNTSVGSSVPIEVRTTTNKLANTQEQAARYGEHRQELPDTPSGCRQQVPDDESPGLYRHYYDDSDDMIERVRRARSAFERKVRAFQGVNWPHYTKRLIVGKRTKEAAPASAEDATTSAISGGRHCDATGTTAPTRSKE